MADGVGLVVVKGNDKGNKRVMVVEGQGECGLDKDWRGMGTGRGYGRVEDDGQWASGVCVLRKMGR